MTREVKEQWLKDLRSGEFVQCRYLLHQVGRTAHCCIGVLHLREHEKTMELVKNYWVQLTNMNDSENKSFLEIADWIEENIIPEDVIPSKSVE